MAVGWLAVWLGWFAVLLVVVGRLVIDDLRHRHLANPLVAAFTALVGVAVASDPFGSDRLQSAWPAIGAGAVAVAAGLALYAAGLLAGGDVKLLFGLAALETRLGSDGWLVYLGLLILVGMVTGFRHLRASPEARAVGIPLAPMLLLGVPPSVLVATVL